jgi:uncharacterized protein
MSEEYNFGDNQQDEFFKHAFGEDNPEIAGGDEEREVRIAGVYEHRTENQESTITEYVVLLKDSSGRTVIIVIGRFEAMSISYALDGQSADRPLTHDLLCKVVDKMNGSVERIVIDDLWNNTYYAKIFLTQKDALISVDARPSDAIAVAIRAKAPIFMTENVLQQAGFVEG